MGRMRPGCFTDLDCSPNPIEQARQRVAATRGYLDLTSSNPTHQGWLFPPDILMAAANAYFATRRYEPHPRGLPAARAAIAHFYATRTPPLFLNDDAIWITASTSEAYGIVFALLADAGDNFLAPNVSYPLFDYLAEMHHVELRPYLLDESRGWRIDSESLLSATDERTRGILIISPHNPTGSVITAPNVTLERLGLPIICDEVFAAFPYGVTAIPPLATLHPSLPIFHLNGISKMFALPDMKLGWIALNDAALDRFADRLDLLNDTLLGASSMIQTMLPSVFDHGEGFVEAMAAGIRTNIEYAVDLLECCPAIHLRSPDGGYYLFAAVRHHLDEEALVIHLLEQHGILVHPGFFFGDIPGTHLLFSALTKPETLREGLDRLYRALI